MKQQYLSKEIILTLQQLDGIGNKTIFKIAKQVMSPITSFSELCEFWPSLKGKKFESIIRMDLEDAYKAAIRIINRTVSEGVGIITFYDTEYPEILKGCVGENGKLDPPIILYYRGNIKALEIPGIALIGTREPTLNGENAGFHFASEFAKRGFNIISGLALGCDTTGHKGALSVGGTTTAFLANGLDWESIYPKENLELAKQIAANGGLLLSEYALGQSCGKYGLVARDRLQAGLSLATVVVQTGINGGTMHAVNATLASHKPLFAVEYRTPSDNEHEKTQGNIMLVRDKGAYPLKSTEIKSTIDIIKEWQCQKNVNSQPSLFD